MFKIDLNSEREPIIRREEIIKGKPKEIHIPGHRVIQLNMA